MVKPIGSKRLNHQGYVQIKVAYGQRRWPFEHRVIWEAVHGPLPEGAFVHHLNKIKTDNRIENLQMVASNAEHHHEYHQGTPRTGTSRALKGRPKSEEHKARIAAAHKGKAKSAEHRAKISATLAGRPRPDISELLKGRTRPLSDEQRARLSEAAKLRQNPVTGRFT